MKHLNRSFQQHVGIRGCHFYDSEACNFLVWQEVFHFMASLPADKTADDFTEVLTATLANYDPDCEFLAVHQVGTSVSVQLFQTPPRVKVDKPA